MREKLTEIMRLRLAPTMADEIRRLAEDEDRSYQDEIRHLLRFALARQQKPKLQVTSKGKAIWRDPGAPSFPPLK
jgi:hypothetical protein